MENKYETLEILEIESIEDLHTLFFLSLKYIEKYPELKKKEIMI